MKTIDDGFDICSMKLLFFLFVGILICIQVSEGFKILNDQRYPLKRVFRKRMTDDKSGGGMFNQPDEEDKQLYVIKKDPTSVDGYISPDISSINQGKQLRVIIYIVLAVLPCLLLIPFFLTRDFSPIDPSTFQN